MEGQEIGCGQTNDPCSQNGNFLSLRNPVRLKEVGDDLVGTSIAESDASSSMAVVVVNTLAVHYLFLHPDTINPEGPEPRCEGFQVFLLVFGTGKVHTLSFRSHNSLNLLDQSIHFLTLITFSSKYQEYNAYRELIYSKIVAPKIIMLPLPN